MKRVKSLVFNRFVLDENQHQSTDLLTMFSEASYSEENGMGFTRSRAEGSSVEATLLKRSFTAVQEFDPVNQELIKKQIPIFSAVSFSINSEMNLLTVYGGQSQLNLVRMMLRNIPGLKYSAEPISLHASTFAELLSEKGIQANIHQLTIRQFNYENGMVGRFSGEVTKQSTAQELLEHYGSAVVKVVFILKIEKEELLVQILPNGNLKVLCEEDDFDYYLAYLKQIIFS
ncbi:hypothetical protein [Pedobacter agri]|uniref:hypothetical protein n=1 Tax=Pedobacter agri TaxID=454586 RepID=UPI00292D1440|nr:hypothetical protein [Pedobacter agri]